MILWIYLLPASLRGRVIKENVDMDEQISKKAALVAVKDALMAWSYMPEWRDEKILEAIAELPSAKPKVGKWERHYSRPNVYADLCWHCSECGYRSSDNWADKFNFCPHCGADMRGDKNA